MKNGKRIALMIAGVLLMGGGVGLTAYNIHEDSMAASASTDIVRAIDEARGKSEKEQLPVGVTGQLAEEPEPPKDEMPTVEINGTAYIGTLHIPALGLDLPVAADWDYKQLKVSPCRYEGTPRGNDLVICAHNYSSHFGKIKDLQAGDAVDFVDAAGERYTYQVQESEVLPPTAIEEMLEPQWDLSLFTCTLGGRTRVTVRLNRTES